MRSGVRVMDTIIVEKKRGRRLASNFLLSLNTVTSVTLFVRFLYMSRRGTQHTAVRDSAGRECIWAAASKHIRCQLHIPWNAV